MIDLSKVVVPVDVVVRKRVPKWQRQCEALWEDYCTKRDFIIEMHKDCLAASARSPRLVFIFAAQPKYRMRTYRAPGHLYPKNRIKQLQALIAHCDYIIANPGGKHGPK